MEKVLKMLDNLEEIRQNISENPKEYTVEDVVLLCCTEVRAHLKADGGTGWTQDMETLKERALSNPANYLLDDVVRLYEAIVAGYGGYRSRTEWISELKHSDSKYAVRIIRDNVSV